MLNESLFNVEITAIKANLFNNLPFVTKCEAIFRGFIFKFRHFYYYSSYMGTLLNLSFEF